MKVRNTRARLCAVLFTSLFTSISFAQVSAVSDRASLAGTDFLDWASYDDGAADGFPYYTWLTSPADLLTNGGAGLTVAHPGSALSPILNEPSPYFRPTNIPDGEYIYSTNAPLNDVNPITFFNFDGLDVCGLGTQVAPAEPGAFIARIEGFDAIGSLGFVDVNGSDTDADAAFVGISSATPMTEVQVSLIDTYDGTGTQASFFAINRVDLRACESGPEVPVVSCSGFEAPMDNYPVKTKKNRVFPLKMELFDADGFALTDLDLAAAPVVEVLFTSEPGGAAIDVTGDVQSVGKASEGNQFVFSDDIWQFKLSSKAYSASGTYLVTAVSGDKLEYVIDPSCMTSFIK